MVLSVFLFSLLVTITTLSSSSSLSSPPPPFSSSLSSDLSQSRVFLAIFAGRRQYLEILRGYLDVLLDQELIDEIHLWDFTRDPVDQKYLFLLERSHEKYKIMHTMRRGELLDEDNRIENWLSFYRYYSSEEHITDQDILIKCDDDIVYLDIESFQTFLTVIRTQSSSHLPSPSLSSSSSASPPHSSSPPSSAPPPSSSAPECNLFFPNIVNNDVCAYLQTQSSVHNLLPSSDIDEKAFAYANPEPLTGVTQYVSWYHNPSKALEIHTDFLSDPMKYRHMAPPSSFPQASSSDLPTPPSSTVIPWYSRISINFFGAMGANIRHSFRLLTENSRDDERYLTSEILPILHKANCIVPSFLVSHFSFHAQRNGYLEWDLRELLPKYYELMVQTLDLQLNSQDEREVRGLRLKRMDLNFTLYRELYSSILLMDDPGDEIQLWSEDLKLKLFTSFGFQETDFALLESELPEGGGSESGSQSCEDMDTTSGVSFSLADESSLNDQ
jgi:hypothetical protein